MLIALTASVRPFSETGTAIVLESARALKPTIRRCPFLSFANHSSRYLHGALATVRIAALKVELELVERVYLAANAGAQENSEGNRDEHTETLFIARSGIADSDPDNLSFGLVVDNGLDQPAEIIARRLLPGTGRPSRRYVRPL